MSAVRQALSNVSGFDGICSFNLPLCVMCMFKMLVALAWRLALEHGEYTGTVALGLNCQCLPQVKLLVVCACFVSMIPVGA